MKHPLSSATIRGLTHEGRGLADNAQGKPVFIDFALPGETLEYRRLKKHAKYEEGAATQLLSDPHPHRVSPPCPYFTLCGGCSLQHMDPAFQIEHKQKTLQEHLQHFGKVAPQTWLAPLRGPTTGYRHKARLGVRYVPNKGMLVGFREVDGRFLTQMDSCEILHPHIGKNILALKALLTSLSIKDQVPQLEVARGLNETVMMIRHLQPFIETDLEKLRAFEKETGILIHLQPGKADSLHRLDSDAEVHFLEYQLEKENIRFRFHPQDFTQINPFMNEAMVNLAISLLELQPQDRVLDLFCGLGNFSLPIAQHCQAVVGVEGSAAMVKRAYENAALNHLHNLEFHAADLSTAIHHHAWAQKQYDKLLLDPPRSGAHELLSLVPQWRASRIVYVSCHPATLARDVGILVNDYGYRLEKAGVMDMFPHTTHVESIAVLRRSW